MKHLIPILIFLIFACKNENKKEENHDDHHHEEKNFVSLSKEEINFLGIKTEKLSPKNIQQTLKANGYVEAPPNSKVSIHSLLDGHIYKTYFLQGDQVKKGDLLLTIKSLEYIDMQKNYLLMKSNLEFIRKDLEREKTLYDQNVISEKEYQRIRTDYHVQKYKLQAIEAKFKLLNISKDKKHKDISPYVKIYSPIDGFITLDNSNKGKFITTDYLLYEIINKDHLHVEIQVYQSDIHKIKINSLFWFFIDNIKFIGRLKLINQKLNKQTKTINIHGHLFDNPKIDSRLKHDMYIISNIVTSQKRTIAIDKNAVIKEEEQNFVFAYKGAAFHKVKVDIGIESQEFMEIINIDKEYADSPIVIQGANTLNNILIKDDFSGHSH